MRNITFVFLDLGVAFLVQLIVWRLYLPRRQIFAILVVFLCTFALMLTVELWMNLLSRAAPTTIFSAIALYFSITFVYMIVFSAVESDSPTLMIINQIAAGGRDGCSEEELQNKFSERDWTMERLRLMEVGGFIWIHRHRCTLSRKGWSYAHLFEASAKLFELPRGG